jgi:hypothetical protein
MGAYDDFGFEQDGQSQPYHPVYDPNDPALAGLTDEEKRAASQPAGNAYDDFVFEEPSAEAPAEEPGLLDQLIAGYHDWRATERTKDALDELGALNRLGKDDNGPLRKWLEKAAPRAAAESLSDAAEHRAKAAQTPLSPETQAFLDENSDKTLWEAFKAAPAKIILELGARSGPASGAALGTGILGGVAAGPVGFVAGTGIGSARIEYVNSVVDALRSRGVDVTNAEALGRAVSNEQLMAEVNKEATIRAATVGGVDALSSFIGGKNLVPGLKSKLAKELANLGVQAPTQAALGAGGEALGQAASGQELDTRSIAAEAAGEFVTAPVEVATAVASGVRGPKTQPGGSPIDDAAKAPPQLDAVEEARQKAKAETAARGGDALDQEVAGALAAAEISAHKRAAYDTTVRQVQEAARTLQVEQDYALGTAQSEEDSARAHVQAEAAARYERGLPAPAPEPLEVVKTTPAVRLDPGGAPSVLNARTTRPSTVTKREPANILGSRTENPVFDVAEREQAAAKDVDFDRARIQRDQQVAEEAPTKEPLRASIGEFATLQERRAAKSVVPAKPVSPTPVVEDVGTNVGTSAQVPTNLPKALPAPREAFTEVAPDGTPRKVSEAEVEQRQADAGKPVRQTLTLGQRRLENAAPIREAAPRTLAERRAAQEAAAKTQVQEIESAAAEAASSPKNELAEPTEGQRSAGNYKMGHTKLYGLGISIETPKGGLRTFKLPNGTTGSRRMRDHYGYVKRTKGADGDHVDVFLGDRPDSQKVFVIDQVKQEDGSFDEHKAMLGYADRESAVHAYTRNYQSGWKVGPVTEMTVEEFKRWSQEGDTKSPLKPDEIRVRKTLAARRRPPQGDDGRLAEDNQPPKTFAERVKEKLDVREPDFAKTMQEKMHFGKSEQQLEKEIDELGREYWNGEIPQGARYEEFKRKQDALQDALWRLRQARRNAERGGNLRDGDKTASDRSIATTPKEKSNAPTGWQSTEKGTDAPRRLTAAKVKAALKPLFDEIGHEGHEVLDSPADMPEEVLRRMTTQHGARRLMNARGLYDRKTGTVYIFADNHTSTEKAVKTAVHEIVAHKGLKQLLGKKWGELMLDVYKNATDQKWIADYAKQHGLDPATNDSVKAILADEYIAYTAERDSGVDPTMLEKVIAAVRAVLRKLGATLEWTDSEIRVLLQKSKSQLASQHAREVSDDSGRLADGEVDPPRQEASHPSARLFKMAVTAEDQANYSPGFVRSRLNAIKDGGVDAIPKVLALVPRRNLPDFISPMKMPSLRAYVRAAQRMDGRRSELLQGAEEVAQRWLDFVRKNKEEARILGELMHAATLAGTDPANAFQSQLKDGRRHSVEQRQADAQRRGQHAALKRHWDRLSPEAKAIYIDVREAYARHRDLVQLGLENRINQAEADGKTKQALINALREKFEAGRVTGPYFPLARFGDYWAVAKDKAGTVISFTRFERVSERKAWVAEMQKQGYKVDTGVKDSNAALTKRIDPGFVAKVAGMLDEIDSEMADEVWQTYLRALPEMSMRRHFIHRKGRLGFTADALRAFAHQQFHGAHQIAKLEHMPVMDSLVNQAELEAKKLEGTDEEIWAARLAQELGKRHEWARNPSSSLWATRLTALGFAFHLGLTPAAALVNLTQTPIVAFPTLAAKYNYLGSGTEILKAAASWAGSRGPLKQRLRGDELKAFEEAERIGLFDKTQAHDLAGLGEDGAMDFGSTRQRISNIISWLFHKTEQANREVTFLAAYRLARKKGLSHEDAILSGEDLTWDSHFDYSNANRPRALQHDAAKVMFLFRQYSLNMTYRLARDFKDSIKHESKQVQKEAQKRFAGILGMTFLFAGTSGLPMFWLAAFVLNHIFGDEDEPFDTEAAMRAHLFEMGGEGWSNAVMDGPVSAISGVDLSSRVGLNNLWWRDPPPGTEGAALGAHVLKEIAGPVVGIPIAMAEAVALKDEGHGDRALEKAAPKAVADSLKALRYAREGVANKRGDTLIPAEQISSKDLFVQSLGFVPLDVATQFDQNRAVKEAEQHITDRRAQLMNMLALTAQNDDPQGRAEVMQQILKFNQKNPGVLIDFDAIWASAKARARYSIEAVNGVRVEPGLRYLHEKLRFTEQENENE